MAKKRDKELIENDAISAPEMALLAEASFMMRKSNKHYKPYKPLPKFKGGCKNC